MAGPLPSLLPQLGAESDCLARRAYRLLLRLATRSGRVPPDLGSKAADRALAEVLGASASTLRNWRRCRARSPQPRLLERARELLPGADDETRELDFLLELTGGARRAARAAEALVTELQGYTLGGDWHLYQGPLFLAFNPNLPPERRSLLMARSSALLDVILERGLHEGVVPALPELIRYSVHGWHHASRFDVRRRSVQERVAYVGAGYLGRVELALYLGDVCAMPALFAGTPGSALPYTERALALLDGAGPTDEAASPVDLADARVMVRAVHAQILACHGGGSARSELDRFEREDGARQPANAWIDSVRLGALGYIALALHDDPAAAAEAFGRAADAVDRWLARAGIPFGSTSHSALAGHALAASGDPERGAAVAQDALLRALEHRVIVDEVAARRVLATLAAERSDDGHARYHRARGAALVDSHRLGAWRAALDRLVRPAGARTPAG